MSLRLVPRPAVDAGPGRGADHPAVRGGLHTAGSVVFAAPSGVYSPGCGASGGGAGRRRHRSLAQPGMGEGTRLAATGTWICFEDESGQALQPPKARTWGRRGHTLPFSRGRSPGSPVNGLSGAGPHVGTWASAPVAASASSGASTCTHTPSRTPPSWPGSPLITSRSTSSFTHSDRISRREVCDYAESAYLSALAQPRTRVSHIKWSSAPRATPRDVDNGFTCC
jgi:hypothetical protein